MSMFLHKWNQYESGLSDAPDQARAKTFSACHLVSIDVMAALKVSMNRSALRLVALGGLVALYAGCAYSRTTPASPSQTASSGPAVGAHPLTPSYPYPSNGSATTTCGSYAMSATTSVATTALAGCDGNPGITPSPRVSLAIGAVVTITGVGRWQPLSVEPAGALDQLVTAARTQVDGQPTTYVAVNSGPATVTIHNAYCINQTAVPQPRNCVLLLVSVHP
jgi:hypothetical protein